MRSQAERLAKFPTIAAYLRPDGDDKSEQIRQELTLLLTPESRTRQAVLLRSTKDYDVAQEHGKSHMPMTTVSDVYEKRVSKSTNEFQTRILQLVFAVRGPLAFDETNVALTLTRRDGDFSVDEFIQATKSGNKSISCALAFKAGQKNCPNQGEKANEACDKRTGVDVQIHRDQRYQILPVYAQDGMVEVRRMRPSSSFSSTAEDAGQ
nr:hypothetical protein L203_01944 [Cryptococcus depauperatus CBS 7841]